MLQLIFGCQSLTAKHIRGCEDLWKLQPHMLPCDSRVPNKNGDLEICKVKRNWFSLFCEKSGIVSARKEANPRLPFSVYWDDGKEPVLPSMMRAVSTMSLADAPAPSGALGQLSVETLEIVACTSISDIVQRIGVILFELLYLFGYSVNSKEGS